MTLTLVRLDDRLVHGQVVVGWGNALGIECLVLINDHVRENESEQELHALGVPHSMELEFASVEEARSRIPELGDTERRVALLVGSVEDAVRLCDKNENIHRINVGGVHMGEGRRERLPYVYLSDVEAEMLRNLASSGIEVTAQDVPSAPAVPAREFL